MNRIRFVFFILICLVGGFIIYFFIFPPRVIETSSSYSPLTIKFDKPVKRQQLGHNISSEVHGQWKFEDPLIKNHLFRTLVFIPAVDFKPDTQYQVKLENITSPFPIGLSNSFTFSFKTNPAFPEQSEPKITLLDIPLDWQDYSLSCEAASLKMALADKRIYVSEDEIMQEIGYDNPLLRQNGLWGDPYKAYVGDINGKICETGYGVYWEPVAEAANNWREVEAFSGWSLEELIREIEAGNSVIFWGVLSTGNLTDCSWHTPAGKQIKAYQETHVRLVVGYIGDSKSPSKIIINDPLSGRLYWSSAYFLTNWSAFGYSGVAVR